MAGLSRLEYPRGVTVLSWYQSMVKCQNLAIIPRNNLGSYPEVIREWVELGYVCIIVCVCVSE